MKSGPPKDRNERQTATMFVILVVIGLLGVVVQMQNSSDSQLQSSYRRAAVEPVHIPSEKMNTALARNGGGGGRSPASVSLSNIGSKGSKDVESHD